MGSLLPFCYMGSGGDTQRKIVLKLLVKKIAMLMLLETPTFLSTSRAAAVLESESSSVSRPFRCEEKRRSWQGGHSSEDHAG